MKLALWAARRANELTNGKSYPVLDTLAARCTARATPPGPRRPRRRPSRRWTPQVPNKSNPAFQNYRKGYEKQLETYRKAAAEKGGKAPTP